MSITSSAFNLTSFLQIKNTMQHKSCDVLITGNFLSSLLVVMIDQSILACVSVGVFDVFVAMSDFACNTLLCF